jgi:hypothetical protein
LKLQKIFFAKLIVLIRGDISLQFKLKLKWMLVRKKGRPSGRHFSSVSLVNIYLVKLQCFPRVPNKLYILKNVIFGVVVFLVFPAKSDKTVFPFHFYKRQVHRRFAFSTSIFRIFVERDSKLLMFKNLPYCAQGDQKENKSRELPHLLFYRNVCRTLIVHKVIFAMHSCFIGCLFILSLMLE